jgi:dienelactone hydrolase
VWPLFAGAGNDARREETVSIPTVTVTGTQFLSGAKDGKPTTITGELRLPATVRGPRVPAVVLVHGAGGIDANTEPWAEEITSVGVAVFVMDSFSGRGLRHGVGDPEGRAGWPSMIVDAYRTLEVLAQRPDINPERIAIMGFSRGGFVALYTSLQRFQRIHGPAGLRFAAHLAFYPGCWITFIDDEKVTPHPIRLFHGADDDWTPVEPCRTYVARRRAGADVELIEYPGAPHGFDMPWRKRRFSETGLGRCRLVERPVGNVINVDTGRKFTPGDACTTQVVTAGFNRDAYTAAVSSVRRFLTITLLRPE